MRAAEPYRRRQLEELKRESDLELVKHIRRRLAMPIGKRTNFLRVRLPLPHGGSCLYSRSSRSSSAAVHAGASVGVTVSSSESARAFLED